MTAPSDPWVTLLTGATLGTYRLDVPIGRGAFGLVFEATHLKTGGRFAVKVLSLQANSDAVLDFENEGVLLKQLNSCQGVISYVDGGTETMNLSGPGGLMVPVPVRYHVLAIASGSMDELILDPVARSQLSWEEKLVLWRGAVQCVRQMHAGGVAHRDLKSSNALLLVQGNLSRVKLADLGRAKDLTLGPTRPPDHYLAGRGDNRFAAPEHLFLQGGASAEQFVAADFYGLGSLFVELATGQPLSSLALGDIGVVIRQSWIDHLAGVHRDLAGLELRYRSVIAAVVATLPKPIQEDASVLLQSLCQPVPELRLIGSPFSKDRFSADRLEWVLRRADIMIRRLQIEALQERRQARRQKVSA